MKKKRCKELVEKLVEKQHYRGGLKMTAGEKKNPKPVDTQQISDLVQVARLELAASCSQKVIFENGN